ncbi:Uncharacterised protein [Vibrio cholerae]|nr:Uncharacterised protein [Vibrio cholerae]CSI73509.1 Uncharacterised protein [Vibrio cholerae]
MRSKSAGWLASSCILLPFTAFMKPSPRSRAAEVPAMPSSWITLASLPIFASIKWPAISPPTTLSDAMWLTTSPRLAPRSSVSTGILERFAIRIALETASESVGLIRIAFTPRTVRSSTFESSLLGSFCESSTIRL